MSIQIMWRLFNIGSDIMLLMDNLPEPIRISFDYASKRKTYRIMNGPNEFTVTGTIKDWDVTDQLGR
ncbi:MAG: hypothetical protein ACP5L5_07400 [Vulcanisaeta sp.]|uniref:hypothetical protein n=1 Tax=Vulcanisaeta sp. TaxID=2020871 RepID=UPI003D0BDF5E